METNTAWDCGAPKSTHTAFTWQAPAPERIVKPTGKKRGPKPRIHPSITALDSPEERKARRVAKNKAATDRILRKNQNQFVPETRASRDRTAAISGKSIYLGSNP